MEQQKWMQQPDPTHKLACINFVLTTPTALCIPNQKVSGKSGTQNVSQLVVSQPEFWFG